ncbi:MAG: SOS response-associated peptidase [Chthonomonadales bacterium]
MCGRYYLTTPPAALMERFQLERSEVDWAPNANIAPTQAAPVILNTLPYTLAAARWGLVPSWADDVRMGSRMFNARAETVAEKPAYRRAFRSRRCLVPADGFYEWRALENGTKAPVQYSAADGSVFAFAGLWEVWQPPGDADPLRTFTLITCPANELVAQVHDRMPVILPRDQERAWLDTAGLPPEEAVTLLRPYPAELMAARQLPPGSLALRRS